MADPINEEVKPVEASTEIGFTSISKSDIAIEYTDSKGEKVKLPSNIFTPESLNTIDPITFDKVTKLVEPNRENACRTCRFWKATLYRLNKEKEEIGIQGVCRFNVPEIVPGVYPIEGRFPPIGPYEWCGKFEAIP